MKSLFKRLRTRPSRFHVCTACDAHGRHCGRLLCRARSSRTRAADSSTDATPLKVVNSTVPPNEFVRIAKQVGPAVVNINTQTLPKTGYGQGQAQFGAPSISLSSRATTISSRKQDQQQGQQQGQGQGRKNWETYSAFSADRC